MSRGTCRCPMCGKKDADTNSGRGSYIKVGIRCNENGIHSKELKRQGRRLRRQREKRAWKNEEE